MLGRARSRRACSAGTATLGAYLQADICVDGGAPDVGREVIGSLKRMCIIRWVLHAVLQQAIHKVINVALVPASLHGKPGCWLKWSTRVVTEEPSPCIRDARTAGPFLFLGALLCVTITCQSPAERYILILRSVSSPEEAFTECLADMPTTL